MYSPANPSHGFSPKYLARLSSFGEGGRSFAMLAVHLVLTALVPRGVHRTAPLRCESAVACAVLTSPPAPPPTFVGGDDFGGGGDDDGGSEFLRLITSCEQAVVLDDWVARSRIYKMTSKKDLRELHTAAIDEYEALRDYVRRQTRGTGVVHAGG